MHGEGGGTLFLSLSFLLFPSTLYYSTLSSFPQPCQLFITLYDTYGVHCTSPSLFSVCNWHRFWWLFPHVAIKLRSQASVYCTAPFTHNNYVSILKFKKKNVFWRTRYILKKFETWQIILSMIGKLEKKTTTQNYFVTR